MSINLSDFNSCVELAFAEINDTKPLAFYDWDEVVFNSKSKYSFQRIPDEVQNVGWASLVRGRATGFHVDMFRTFEELYKSRNSGFGYYKGYKVSIAGFPSVGIESINECLIKTKLLIDEISDEYTLKIVKKHMTASSKRVYDNRFFHLCVIDKIELLILNLNEEYEILPLTSVLKSKS